MKIIQQKPNPVGAFPPIQTGNFSDVPPGTVRWDEELDTSAFYQYNGFVVLTIVDDVVVDYEADVEAWQKWKDGQDEQENLPSEPVDPITQLEDALCDMDAAQEERLSAIEEALCELDEILNGGTEDA